MERRRFVQLALGSVAFASLAAVTACRGRDACLPEGADAAWADLSRKERARLIVEASFGESAEDARAIGALYLEQAAAEADVETFRCRHVEGQNTLEQALASIDAQILTEFSERRIINLEGWIFAEAELMRCALAV